jgi:hypothetical protein
MKLEHPIIEHSDYKHLCGIRGKILKTIRAKITEQKEAQAAGDFTKSFAATEAILKYQKELDEHQSAENGCILCAPQARGKGFPDTMKSAENYKRVMVCMGLFAEEPKKGKVKVRRLNETFYGKDAYVVEE